MDSRYFTLKYKGSSPWCKAARVAMRAFAAEIESFDPKLSREIKDAAYQADRQSHMESLEAKSA
jgi:hypothetical protein